MQLITRVAFSGIPSRSPKTRRVIHTSLVMPLLPETRIGGWVDERRGGRVGRRYGSPRSSLFCLSCLSAAVAAAAHQYFMRRSLFLGYEEKVLRLILRSHRFCSFSRHVFTERRELQLSGQLSPMIDESERELVPARRGGRRGRRPLSRPRAHDTQDARSIRRALFPLDADVAFESANRTDRASTIAIRRLEPNEYTNVQLNIHGLVTQAL